VTIFYSILPDIDTNSKVRSWVIPALLLIAMTMFALKQNFYALVLLVPIPLIFLLKHRGITHSIIAAIVLSIPLLFLNGFAFSNIISNLILMPFAFIAYISHMLADGEVKWL